VTKGMCGIVGLFAYHPASPAIDRDELVCIRDHMAARGPDGKSDWYSHNGRIGLGHRRLAIIDCSATGAQPMTSADGKLVITFNGEIYNYRALRGQLEAKGRVFRTQSDTEVLLHLYAEKGPAMVDDLRGMFAFSIWDCEQQRLFLARDPYGIKPLYYADDGLMFRFASSVKALIAGRQVSREADAAGVVGFYLFGSIPEPFTLYRSIRALAAGTSMMVDRHGSRELAPYANISALYLEAEFQCQHYTKRYSESEIREEFRAALADSVHHHLVSDVPVGAFLSSGVDSGALVGMMRDAGQKDIRTVTLAFEEFEGTANDESPLASLVARQYGTKHSTRWVGAAEFHTDLPKILAAMDQPSIDGINTWFVSKAANELGLKVAISGVGGDELLGGYSTFKTLPSRVGFVAGASRLPGRDAGLNRLLGAARALGFRVHAKSAGLLTYGGTYAGAYLLSRGLFLPAEINDVVRDENMVSEGLARLRPLSLIGDVLKPDPQTSFAKVATLESCFYLRNQLLRDSDWAGMAHSLEIRTPLVD
jgi:asparagine synthase (glutamine-hydrolysing)